MQDARARRVIDSVVLLVKWVICIPEWERHSRHSHQCLLSARHNGPKCSVHQLSARESSDPAELSRRDALLQPSIRPICGQFTVRSSRSLISFEPAGKISGNFPLLRERRKRICITYRQKEQAYVCEAFNLLLSVQSVHLLVNGARTLSNFEKWRCK